MASASLLEIKVQVLAKIFNDNMREKRKKMSRKIIQIDEEKCIGCGLCASACAQSALKIVDGKAKLISNDYCDGLGKCLPKCPVNAISFSDIEVTFKEMPKQSVPSSCPSSNLKTFKRSDEVDTNQKHTHTHDAQTNLLQWPVQIKLIPVNAAYFDNANLLIAADCTAYAYGNFHNDFMRNKITIIACPKLDDCNYTEKLSAIIETNNIKSVTIVRMDVPCCGGIEDAAKTAIKNCTKMIPWQLVVISTDGTILDGRWTSL